MYVLLQYYYNSDTQSYLYWDAGVSTYLPAPDFKPEADQSTAQIESAAGDKSDKTKDKDKKDKNDKNKMAKKVLLSCQNDNNNVYYFCTFSTLKMLSNIIPPVHCVL